MRSSKFILFSQLAVVLLIAFALKYHYSTASVNDLRWILAPTTFLVEAITGKSFMFESQAGYMSSDHTFLIAASCSGVNFLIIAFLLLTVGRIWSVGKMEWRFVPIAMLIAYITTLLANTTRIVVALSTRGVDFELSWLTPDSLHRLEGVLVYFGALFLLFISSEALERRASVLTSGRRLILPLGLYYAVTLGVPIAGGAYSEIEFWKHSVVVLLAPFIVILPMIIVYFARSTDVSEGDLP